MAQAIFANGANFELHFYTPSLTRAEELAKKTGGSSYNDISKMPKNSIHFIACKPQQFSDLASKLANHIEKDCIIVSIMAGITSETISEKLNSKNIIRIMPSTPSFVKQGISLWYETLNSSETKNLKKLFEEISLVVELQKEEEIDLVTPITGCSPAYFFEMARLFENFLNERNFQHPKRREFIIQAFLGAAQYMKESDHSFEELRNQVTSKKGATEEVLNTLGNHGFSQMWTKALDRGVERSQELSKIQ